MPDLINSKWLDFIREFEKTDPEPPLHHNVLTHNKSYFYKSVDAHMAWHRRLTDAWVKRGIQ